MYGFDHRRARPETSRLMDMMVQGVLDTAAVADMCLAYMNEAEVADMMQVNDLVEEE